MEREAPALSNVFSLARGRSEARGGRLITDIVVDGKCSAPKVGERDTLWQDEGTAVRNRSERDHRTALKSLAFGAGGGGEAAPLKKSVVSGTSVSVVGARLLTWNDLAFPKIPNILACIVITISMVRKVYSACAQRHPRGDLQRRALDLQLDAGAESWLS